MNVASAKQEVFHMKLIGMAVCLAVVCSAGLAAQTAQTESKSKVTVKDGQDVTVTGCVESTAGGAASGTAYMLTHVADNKTGSMHNYMLVTDDGDLAKHVGHRMQIEGKVTDKGDGKIKVETKTKTKVDGDDKETKSKSEIKGDMAGARFLGVKSMKMIAAACP
jgi:hypothetical protein